MNFLKKIFGGGGGARGDAAGMYFYVRPENCDEVIRIRIDRNNDLTPAEGGRDYFVRKMITPSDYHCERGVELHVTFDAKRNPQTTEVLKGALVAEADYVAWVEGRADE